MDGILMVILVFVLFVQDCIFEFKQLMVQVLGDVFQALEDRDRHSLPFVVDYDQGFGALDLLQVHFLQAGRARAHLN